MSYIQRVKKEKVLNDFIKEYEVLHYTYDRWSLLTRYYPKVHLHAYVNDYIYIYIFTIYILSLVFLSLKLYVNCLV